MEGVLPKLNYRTTSLCVHRTLEKSIVHCMNAINRMLRTAKIFFLYFCVTWKVATGMALSALFLIPTLAWSQPVAGSLEVHWNEGASDCNATPRDPLQVHSYEPQTFILRQSPCADFEANFIYLLVGSDKALLIDTGAVADPNAMPLAKTVLELLPEKNGRKLPLLVAHTHRHLDHRAGDPQFASIPLVQVVPFDLDGVQSFFGFTDWPNGIAHIDLGGRTVDVIPTPGHNKTHVAFYDGRTAILFSGDFLLPGRLLIEDTAAYHESALRIVDFLKTRPLTHILGGHIELNAAGRAYRFGSQYHPDEHRLELARADLTALPTALEHFNGFYARYPNYILTNPIRNLVASAIIALALLIFTVWGVCRFLRRRRRLRG
jgi:glyoxylase-like metal-dependent hydrolase (beta-lactamase superfamily II)